MREFITGRLLTAFLDLMTLCVLLPFLFWLNAALAWIVLGCACVIAIVIVAFLRPMGVLFGRVVAAETAKQSVLGETVFGVRTVKSLGTSSRSARRCGTRRSPRRAGGAWPTASWATGRRRW